MTERENALLAIHHGKPEWIPCFYTAYHPMGCSLINDQGERGKGGRDLFGSLWLVTADTGYSTIHSPNEHILDDVRDWRNIVKFPDLDSMDWAGGAARDLQGTDRENKLVCLFGITGEFNRFEALMGTPQAMVAMVDEPEACREFFDAYADFKVAILEKLGRYYKPDIYVTGDDVAMSTGLFISPDVYRALLWPAERRIAQAAIAQGMIVEHHVCGKAGEILPDIIATGASVWQMAQRMNDLATLMPKFKNDLCFHGGWDSIGPATQKDATEADVRGEVRRCIDTYGRNGNYMLFPVLFSDPADPRTALRYQWVADECRRYRPA